jgi:branched-chain amino acid transport system substrate-binding protein
VFGKQLQRDTSRVVTQAGAKVVGASAYPFPETTDFSSYLASARASGAKVLGLANAGKDLINAIKQAREFSLKMRLAALLMFLPDIQGLGLELAQGLVLTESFYWDLNNRTRAFTDRVKGKLTIYPHMLSASVYAGTLHYLKAVADIGAASAKRDGAGVVTRMRAMPTDDDCFGQQRIREDGLFLCPAFLFQVKLPAESAYPWDFYKLLATTTADEAWEPLSESECSLLKNRQEPKDTPKRL